MDLYTDHLKKMYTAKTRNTISAQFSVSDTGKVTQTAGTGNWTGNSAAKIYDAYKLKNDTVTEMQQSLNVLEQKDTNGDALKVDGVFGPKTQSAWDEFVQTSMPGEDNQLAGLAGLTEQTPKSVRDSYMIPPISTTNKSKTVTASNNAAQGTWGSGVSRADVLEQTAAQVTTPDTNLPAQNTRDAYKMWFAGPQTTDTTTSGTSDRYLAQEIQQNGDLQPIWGSKSPFFVAAMDNQTKIESIKQHNVQEQQDSQGQTMQQAGAMPEQIAAAQAGAALNELFIEPLLNWCKQKVNQTQWNTDRSKAAYLSEKALSGAASATESGYNGLIDAAGGWATANLLNGQNDPFAQNTQMALGTLLGGQWENVTQHTQEVSQQAVEQIPEVTAALRSDAAHVYAAGIDNAYGAPSGWYQTAGNIADNAGALVPSIAMYLLGGGALRGTFQFLSGLGDTTARARAGGADDNTALLYGAGMGLVDAGAEALVGGIPGLGNGVMDDALAGLANGYAGQLLLNSAGEGVESYINTMADAYLSKLWNGDVRSAWQTFVETNPAAVAAACDAARIAASMNLGEKGLQIASNAL